MTLEEKKYQALTKLLVNLANPNMNGKWDTKMYRQKEEILKILEQ